MIVTQNASIFDYASWESQLPELSSQFVSAQPFPHIVLDNFLNVEYAKKLVDFLPKAPSDWFQYHHVNNHTYAHRDRYQASEEILPIVEEFHSERMLSFLSTLTGIKNLISDESFEGGSFMRTKRGGKLNIHTDFLSHPHKKKLKRELNLLLYLNPNWQENYGGHLELWENPVSQAQKRILPVFNRCVIFKTTEDSYHGFPDPLQCPEEISRNCLGLYYYSKSNTTHTNQSTRYYARPQDSPLHHMAVSVDNKFLEGYRFLKRHLGLTDRLGSTLMKLFSR